MSTPTKIGVGLGVVIAAGFWFGGFAITLGLAL